jgi:hypothetical protein
MDWWYALWHAIIDWLLGRRPRLRRISVQLRAKKGGLHMNLTVVLGTSVNLAVLGHSAVNGANIPEDATVALTSNDPSVATVPATLPVPPGGSQQLTTTVTVLAAGSTDIHGTVTLADGSVFEDTATLLVTPLPVPGLVRIELVLSAA